MITVYHVDFNTVEKIDLTLNLYHKLTYRPTIENIQEGIEKGCYLKVAEVNTTNLDSAYELTNNIDSPWDQNFGVTPVKNGNRSTSIGDLMLCNNELYVVDRMGFTKLPLEVTKAFLTGQNITTSDNHINSRYKFK